MMPGALLGPGCGPLADGREAGGWMSHAAQIGYEGWWVGHVRASARSLVACLGWSPQPLQVGSTGQSWAEAETWA